MKNEVHTHTTAAEVLRCPVVSLCIWVLVLGRGVGRLTWSEEQKKFKNRPTRPCALLSMHSCTYTPFTIYLQAQATPRDAHSAGRKGLNVRSAAATDAVIIAPSHTPPVLPLLLRLASYTTTPTMFDIELSLPGSSSHTVILRRDYQEFRALHLALTNLLTSSKVRFSNEAWADAAGRFLGLCVSGERVSKPH